MASETTNTNRLAIVVTCAAWLFTAHLLFRGHVYSRDTEIRLAIINKIHEPATVEMAPYHLNVASKNVTVTWAYPYNDWIVVKEIHDRYAHLLEEPDSTASQLPRVHEMAQ